MSKVFERICREYVNDVYKVKVERAWYKDVEIDVYGGGIAGECKWSDDVDGERVLYQLTRKVEKLELNVKKYIIFARGFSKVGGEAEFIDLKSLEKWYRGG